MATEVDVKTDWLKTNIFTYVMIAVCAFIVGILMANAIYFRKIATSSTASAIPKDQANVMFVFNLIMVLIVGCVMVYAIFRAVVGVSRYNRYKQNVKDGLSSVKNWATSHAEGIPSSSSTAVGAPADAGK